MAEQADSSSLGFGKFAGPWNDARVKADPVGWIGALSAVAENLPGAGERLRDYRAPITMTLSGGASFRIGGGDLYFIGADDGPIKIGFSANPKVRLRSLQLASPFPLRLLAVVKDESHLEREYHKRFAAHRLHGEWFERCPEIQAEIDRINARLSTPEGEG